MLSNALLKPSPKIIILCESLGPRLVGRLGLAAQGRAAPARRLAVQRAARREGHEPAAGAEEAEEREH